MPFKLGPSCYKGNSVNEIKLTVHQVNKMGGNPCIPYEKKKDISLIHIYLFFSAKISFPRSF